MDIYNEAYTNGFKINPTNKNNIYHNPPILLNIVNNLIYVLLYLFNLLSKSIKCYTMKSSLKKVDVS